MKDTPRRCAKCGKSTVEYPSLAMYRFPKPGSWNVRRIEAWAKFIHPDENWSNNDLHQKLYRSHKMLCEDHFEKTAFIDFFSRKLHRYSCPNDVDHNQVPQPSTSTEPSSMELKYLSTEVINMQTPTPSKMTKGNANKEVEGRVVNFDHLIFWVANAKTASSYFVTRFGFKPLAVREATEDRQVVSYAVRINKITIVFESPSSAGGEISKELSVHSDFVKDVAFEVQNLDELVRRAKDGGAEIVRDITVEGDDDGTVRYAVLKTYGDNTHTLIDRSQYRGLFLPGFKAADDDVITKLLPDTNLLYIDHVEGNMADGTLEDSLSWYEKNLNMQRFWCVDYKHDLSPFSCINTGSVINKDETVLLSLNEAAPGLRPSSKATDFVKALGAPGVEHIALYTDDIVATMRNLKSRGAEILHFPSTYYTIIREKLKAVPLNISESIEALQECGVLIDFDERGYMLQAFTKHLQARPTVFIEVIQRRNHRGFGSQNYQWVFEAIELLDKVKEDKE